MSRTQTVGVTEGVGGLRVGDVTGADDVHGLVASNVFMRMDLENSERSVELQLDDGKSGYSR